MKGSPWQPRGLPTVMPKTPGGVAAPGTPGGRPKGVYITLDRQIRYGSTPDCPGCTATLDNPKPHNAECRVRKVDWRRKSQGSSRAGAESC